MSLSESGNGLEEQKYIIRCDKKIVQHDDVVLRHVIVESEGSTFEFLVRVIDKLARSKRIRRRLSVKSLYHDPGTEYAFDRIEISEQIDHPNLLQFYAVRNREAFVILCNVLFQV